MSDSETTCPVDFQLIFGDFQLIFGASQLVLGAFSLSKVVLKLALGKLLTQPAGAGARGQPHTWQAGVLRDTHLLQC